MSILERGSWTQIEFASNSNNYCSLPELSPAHSITSGESEDGSLSAIPPNLKTTRSPIPIPFNANDDEDDRSSVYSSIHERETDECRDTSDTDGESSASEIMEVLEYEVASTSESDNFFANTSSSGTDDGFIILANLSTSSDTSSTMGDCDIEFFADTESDDSMMASDPELSRADYWECVKCRNKKNNPMYSFCQVCFQKRKSLYPPPPTRKRPRSEFRDNLLKRQLSQQSEKNSITKRPRSGTPDSNSSTSLASPKRRYSNKAGNNISLQSINNQQTSKRSTGESTDFDSNSDHDLGIAPKSSVERNRIGFLSVRSPRRQLSSVKSQPSTSSTGVSMFNNSSQSNGHDNREPVTTVGELTPVVSGDSSTATNSTNNQNFQSSLSLGVASHSRKREASYEREMAGKRMKLGLEIRSATIVDQQNAPECSNMNSSSIIGGKLKNKFLQNVACTSAPSDADSSDSGQPTKSLPESTASSKDSGFSSCSLQELNSQTFDSQETYCSEIAVPVKPSGSGMLEQMMNPNVFLASSLTRNASSMSDTQYTVLDSQNSQLSQASSSASTSDTNLGTCIICLTNIKDGVFVHKSKVHLCCCYKCAKQIWRQRKRCPVCNGKVTTVAKLFAS